MKRSSFVPVSWTALRALILLVVSTLWLGVVGNAWASDGGTSAPPSGECDDQIDNDGDNSIDYPEDSDCTSYDDTSEGPGAARALSGASAIETYYQRMVGSEAASALASSAPDLPSELFVEDASATASYVRSADGGWELRIEGFQRNHERVDAIYDMILVLPMPATREGGDAFQTRERGVRIEEGPPERSVPLVYGGEKVVLKRNVGLEKGLLARLVGDGPGKLPSLEGTGQRWTAWNAILTRDAAFGDVVQARAVLRYEAVEGASAPDATDPRNAAYLITWIPSLPASIPPYAVRIDVE